MDTNGNLGGAVTVAGDSVMNMYGGTIRDGYSSSNTGNVYVSGTLNMMGGTITGGKLGSNGANSNAANVRVTGSGKLNMTGGTIDGHVHAGSSKATVVLSGDAKIFHAGNRGLWVIIGNTNLQIGDLSDKAQIEIITRDTDGNAKYGVFASAVDGYSIQNKDVSKLTVTGLDGTKVGNIVLNTDNTLSVEKLN